LGVGRGANNSTL